MAVSPGYLLLLSMTHWGEGGHLTIFQQLCPRGGRKATHLYVKEQIVNISDVESEPYGLPQNLSSALNVAADDARRVPGRLGTDTEL